MTDFGGRTHRFRDRFDAAQAASRRSRHAPPSLPQAVGSRLSEPHPQFDTVIEVRDIQRLDISSRIDDAFAQAEAKREVFQIPFLGWHGSQLGQVDSLFLTAVLTVVGFSVHDTIVIFDRIRENMIVAQRLTFEQIVNLSIMQSAARSIITSFTVVLVLLSLFLFGGDTLKGFVLALLIGIISGTYSSIFNAAPLLVVMRRLWPVR